jgi:hypothetical protein
MVKSISLANGELTVLPSDTLSRISTKAGSLRINSYDGATEKASVLITNGGQVILTGTGNSMSVGANFFNLTSSTAVQINNVLQLNPITNAERNAISPLNGGMVIFNVSTFKLQVYTAGGWVDLH